MDADELFDPKRAKAAAIYAGITGATGLVWAVNETAGVFVVVGAVIGHWVAGQLLARRQPQTPDLLDGAAELTHRARLELDDLAHRLPEYKEAAGYLELAEEALARAASTPKLPG